jgi:peptidoglycan/LPS O-acetylase OafA/YrhL
MRRESNNFDFLRLFAAGLVLVGHLSILSGTKDDWILILLDSLSLGSLGVSIFFVISGYLVTQSWIKDPVPHRYAARRALRIFPGLVAVVLLTMLALGPFVSKFSPLEYFREPSFLRYLNALLLFPMPFALPGVFYDNPYPVAVNGSLWTLPYEATMYLLLPLFARPKLRESAIYWASLAALFIIASESSGAPSFEAPTVWFLSTTWLYYFGAFFFYGAALSVLQKRFGAPNLAVAGAFLLILIVSAQSQWIGLTRHLLLGYVVIALGLRATPFLKSAGRYGDFSYGIYIYAFPVQQTLVHFGLARNVFSNVLYLTTITLLLAALSWIFVEKPALLMKPSRPSKGTP